VSDIEVLKEPLRELNREGDGGGEPPNPQNQQASKPGERILA